MEGQKVLLSGKSDYTLWHDRPEGVVVMEAKWTSIHFCAGKITLTNTYSRIRATTVRSSALCNPQPHGRAGAGNAASCFPCPQKGEMIPKCDARGALADIYFSLTQCCGAFIGWRIMLSGKSVERTVAIPKD